VVGVQVLRLSGWIRSPKEHERPWDDFQNRRVVFAAWNRLVHVLVTVLPKCLGNNGLDAVYIGRGVDNNLGCRRELNVHVNTKTGSDGAHQVLKFGSDPGEMFARESSNGGTECRGFRNDVCGVGVARTNPAHVHDYLIECIERFCGQLLNRTNGLDHWGD
jgi:hypothetical protein